MGYSVTFAWIPGHVGIAGNTKADQLANDAVRTGDIVPYLNYPQDLVTLSTSYLKESWDRMWCENGQIKGRFFFNIQKNISLKPWFSRIDINKTSTSIIIRIRLGHNCTPAHLARIGILQSPVCECGYDVGDINHIFFACPLYDRSNFLNSLLSSNVPFPSSVPCLLCDNDPNIYKIISDFIIQNNIKL